MIKIDQLTKEFGGALVLDGIDLHADAGEIVAVVGPSGAGKSTLARCINLLERPTSGTIEVNGQNLTRLRGRELRAARRQLGTVFQSASLMRRLTAAQNVALPLRYLGLSDAEQKARVVELLERVGMLHRANHYPSQLSGGQRQRIGLARALALRPSVLLSDEATSGLDPDATANILSLIKELRSDLGVTFLVITHEMDVVRAVADSVYQLDQGRIAEHGPVAEVVRRSDSPLSRALVPQPTATEASDLRAWQVRYRSDVVDPTWVSQLSRLLSLDVALLGALIEDVDGRPVGRATIGVASHIDPNTLQRVAHSLGLAVDVDARELARADAVDFERAIA